MSNFKSFIVRVRKICFVVSIWFLGFIVGSTSLYSYSKYDDLMGEVTISIENKQAVHTPSNDAVQAEWFQAEFSAYTASEDETDANPSIMASGKKVYKGAIACPRAVDFGSIVEIKDMGKFVCEDRMNIRYKNNFDIFMESKDEAMSFGRKTLNYRII